MSQVCRNCSRPNPPDAVYCYYDGFALGGRDIHRTLPLQPGTQSFVTPFVFPSGRSCRNFDELVRAAFELWEEARELLKDGSLANFLGGLGRADLARLARQAMAAPESDRALDEFLGGLPELVPGGEISKAAATARKGNLIKFTEPKSAGYEIDPQSVALGEAAQKMVDEDKSGKLQYGEALKIARRQMGSNEGSAAAGAV